MIVFLIGFIIILCYGILICYYIFSFRNLNSYEPNSNTKVPISATILIPCRDPNSNLLELIDEMKSQIGKSAQIEILVINDFSNTKNVLNNTHHIDLAGELPNLTSATNNKKQAINLGVNLAKFETIICLDADVRLNKDWWIILSNFIADKNPKFAAGLHRYSDTTSFLNKFLRLEQDILTASSIAALLMGQPTMCNGAFVVFSKAAYNSVNGYEGLYHINGGDDLLLYHRIFKQYPLEVFYIKNLSSAVESTAASTWTELIHQRTRWISKSADYELSGIKIQALLILMANVTSVLSLFWIKLVPIFVVKILIDLIFIFQIKPFYRFKYYYRDYIVFSIIYPFYSLTIVIYLFFNSIFPFKSKLRERL